ncbi:MAG: hypothetical protein KDC80_15870 [Saprospiraceae bacterium]|nr:hypothetical protein [Saprospiraceae bacterium]
MIKLCYSSLALCVLLFSCSPDLDIDPNSGSDSFSQMVSGGDWQLTYFWDSEKDESGHFRGYSFQFLSDHSIIAVKGTSKVNGHWTLVEDHSSDDSSRHLHFKIIFTAPPDFEELSEDWQVLRQGVNKIELIHVSGGNGGIDYLTFER